MPKKITDTDRLIWMGIGKGKLWYRENKYIEWWAVSECRLREMIDKSIRQERKK